MDKSCNRNTSKEPHKSCSILANRTTTCVRSVPIAAVPQQGRNQPTSTSTTFLCGNCHCQGELLNECSRRRTAVFHGWRHCSKALRRSPILAPEARDLSASNVLATSGFDVYAGSTRTFPQREGLAAPSPIFGNSHVVLPAAVIDVKATVYTSRFANSRGHGP